METGIDYRAANKRHFRTKTKKRLALEAELLRTMEFYDEGRRRGIDEAVDWARFEAEARKIIESGLELADRVEAA